jgi:Fur family ferric uptake transcriptional regulator
MAVTMENVMLKKCIDAGLRMTSQRETIAMALDQSYDHPDAELLYKRANEIDSTISIATIYRTLGIFERAGLVQKVDVGDGKSHYEIARDQHEHLVDTQNGQIHEFKSEELTALLSEIADKMGFELTSHKLEVYGKKHGDVACRCIQIKVY